jgi:hypothetical protein
MKDLRVLRICAKCSDLFNAIYAVNDRDELTHDGYVPDFMPGEHYGDYVELDINIDTGVIMNWKTPTKTQLRNQLNGQR